MAIDPIKFDSPLADTSKVDAEELGAALRANEVPAKPTTALVTRTYTDGTVVETKFDVTTEPRSIMQITITRPDGSREVYARKSLVTGNPNDKRFVIVQHHFRPTGQVLSHVPGGSINPETGEFRLVKKYVDVADPFNTRDAFPHVLDPTDDVGVLEVTSLPDLSNDTWAIFEITLEDGTTVSFAVERSLVPPGKTAEDLAVDMATKIGTLPPKIRTTLATMKIELSSFSKHDLPGRTPRGGIAMGEDESIIAIDPTREHVKDPSNFLGLLVHEMGHVIDFVNGSPTISSSPEWEAAMNADNADVSVYAGTSRLEDFAETYSLWYQVRSGEITGPEAAAIESRYENRFAILDNTPQAVDSLPDPT